MKKSSNLYANTIRELVVLRTSVFR